jgi:hypothetical protein
MILSRAAAHLTDPADVEELDVARWGEGASFDLIYDPQRRARVARAVLEGTEDLRQQIAAGEPTEEPVRPGAGEFLDELISFLSRK